MPENIALFLPNLVGGGAERAMVAMAAGLAEAGISVDLVLATASGPFLDEVPAAVHVVDLHAGRTARALVPLVSYLRTVRPRVLLVTLNHASVVALAGVLLSRARTKTIVREASTFSLSTHGLMRCLTSIAYRLADGFVAVSSDAAEDLIATLDIPRRKVRVIYNPVVSASFRKMAQEEISHPWFLPGEPPVILGTGRLSPEKDFPTLLRAFAIVRRRVHLRLLILGEGPERARLEQLARELGVSADFALPGFVLNPFPYMSRARVFVLSSVWEGLPNVLIQAIALGTPVVATDCKSGPREICDGIRTAALVPVGGVPDMASAILHALDMPRTPQLRSALQRFESQTIVRQFLEFVGWNRDRANPGPAPCEPERTRP